MKKRLFSVLLSAALLTTLLPTEAAASVGCTCTAAPLCTAAAETDCALCAADPAACLAAPAEAPEVTPAEAPAEAPEETPEETPDETPEETPEEVPEEPSAEAPEQTPEEPSAEAPEQTPEEPSAEAPEQTSLEAPEDIFQQVQTSNSAAMADGRINIDLNGASYNGNDCQNGCTGHLIYGSTTENHIWIGGGTHTIILDNVTCKRDAEFPIDIEGGSVTIVLKGHNTLTGTGLSCIDADVSFTIKEHEEGGSLTLTSDSAPAIACTGTVTIESGTVDITSSSQDEAINCTDLTINGGKVTVSGNHNAINCTGTLTSTGGILNVSSTSGYPIRATTVQVSGGYVIATQNADNDLPAIHTTYAKLSSGALIAQGGEIYTNAAIADDTVYSGGFLWDDTSGYILGDATLPIDLTTPISSILHVPEGITFTIPQGVTLTNKGKIENDGTLDVDGTLINSNEIINDSVVNIAGTLNNNSDFNNYGTVNVTGSLTGEEITGLGTLNITYTVTFQDGDTSTSQVAVYNQPIDEPTAPTKNGYAFGGWYLNDEAYDFTTPVIESITLTAQWTPNTSTLKVTGGTYGDDYYFDDKGDLYICTDAALTISEATTGAIINCIRVLSDISGGANLTLSKLDINYYDCFLDAKSSVNIILVGNILLRTDDQDHAIRSTHDITIGGTGTLSTASTGKFSYITCDGTLTITGGTYGRGEAAVFECSSIQLSGGTFPDGLTLRNCTLADALAEGYSYYDKNDSQITSGLTGNSLTYTVTVKPASFTVTFANTGDPPMEPLTLTTDQSFQKPADPERAGYTFRDWTVYAENGSWLGFGQPLASNTTLTAVWELNAPTIKTTAYTSTYTGQPQQVAITAEHALSDLTYKVYKGDSLYSAANPFSVTNVADSGEYRIEVTVTDDEGNTATAEETITVTIGKATVPVPTIPSKVYTGSELTADVPTNNLYTVKENRGGNGVGSYPVTLILTDTANYQWLDSSDPEIRLSFSITQAENSWVSKPNVQSGEYTGSPMTYSAAAKFGQVTYRWLDASSAELPSPPTTPGSYTMIAQVEETQNYKKLETSVSFTITPKPLKADFSEKTYDGSASFTDLPLTLIGVVLNDDVRATASGTLKSANAGTQEVSSITECPLTGADKDNYTLALTDISVSVTVRTKEITPTVTLAEDSYGYTGQPHTPAVTVKDGDTILAEDQYTVAYTNNIAAGQATVTISPKEGGNYSFIPAASQFTITKATPAAPDAGDGYILNLTAETITISDGYAVTKNGEPLTSGDPIAPGDELSIYKTASDNYTDSAPVTFTVPSRPAAPTGLTGVRESQLDQGDGKITGVTDAMEYRLGTDGDWISCTGTEITNLEPGEYHVRKKATDTEFASEAAEVTVDPGKLIRTIQIAPISEKTYGDAPFTLSLAQASRTTGAVTFTSSDTAILSIEGTTATIHKAGTVTITATQAEDDTYQAATATASLTIAKAQLTVTASDKTITEGDALPRWGYTVQGRVNGDTYTRPTVTVDTDGKTPGKFDILISGGTLSNADCYDVTYINGTLTVLDVYQTTQGAKQETTQGTDAAFTSAAKRSKFLEVQVDGKKISSEHYTISGLTSTKATLKGSYLSTLSTGSHTLRIVFTDGYSETTFTVKARPTDSDSPKTGDTTNSALWLTVTGIGLAGFLTALLGKKYYRRHK